MNDYQFKNKFCPVCGEPVGPYFYTYNDEDKKIHFECEDKE